MNITHKDVQLVKNIVKDNQGTVLSKEHQYPITKASLVITKDQTNIDDKIDGLSGKINYHIENHSDSGGSYVHPSTHPASIITTNQYNRFVTDNQISTWSSKEPAFEKKSAFNKDFGVEAGTVAEGNHTHTFNSIDFDIIKDVADITIDETINVLSVSLNTNTISFYQGNTTQLIATVFPALATNKSIIWSSSDSSIATVSATGLVTGANIGSATITATTVDGGKTATCSVVVSASIISVTGISLNKSSTVITQGNGEALIATVIPSNATNKDIIWTTSNGSIASVGNGVITANGVGSATITARTVDGNYSATCSVNVISATVSVTGISLSKSASSLQVFGTEQLTTTIYPPNATNKNVIWSTSNSNIATVSTSGLVTAVNSGDVTITATTQDGGKVAICTYTISSATINVTGVSLNKSTLSLMNGKTEQLIETITPNNATNKSVQWFTSNGSVATVNSYGLVTAVGVGSAIISIKTVDGNYTTTCNLTVTSSDISATSVSLNKYNTSIIQGNTEQLTATVYPTNATNKNVTWSSSNSSIVSVNSSGLITANSVGTATITVTTVDGNKTATCGVTVNSAIVSATGVSLNKTTLSLTNGNNETLIATVLPSNASNKSVTWTSSNTSVATVNSSGWIQSVGVGTSIITVRTVDGDYSATCNLTITSSDINVTSVSLNKYSASITQGNTETLTATVYPSNATNKNVTWSSNNTSVATVSSSGAITGVGAGSATIIVTTVDGGKTTTCSVTVTASVSDHLTVNPYSYNISGNTLTVNYTSSKTLTNVKLSTNGGISYDISNTSFTQTSATFNVTNSDGTYTCKLQGSYDDGSSGNVSVTGVSLNKSTTSIANGSTEQLTATVIPTNATNKNVIWTSSNTSVAAISSTGLITGVGVGSAIITVRTVDGNITSTCNVTITSSGGGTGEQWTPTLSQFGIYNDGTNAQATSDGLNAMLDYASVNGKSYVKMPAGTYLIQKDTPVNMKSDITLDLNGATFKMETNNKSGYQIMIMKEIKNAIVKNGILEGDRYTHDYTGYDANTNSHEFGISVRLDQGAENCIIEDMTIKKMSGYGIYTAQGQGYGTTINLNRSNLESGSYDDNGVKTADSSKIRYNVGVDISRFASLGYFQVGTYLKYQNFLFNSTRTVTALVFNASNVLVKKVTTQLYRPIEIPTDAKTTYLVFHQASPIDLLEDANMYSLDIFHMKPNKNCIIRNNTFDDNRCLGLAVCGGWNLLVENNEFKNTSKDPATVPSQIWQAGKPGYGIDVEDGWESTEDLTIRSNTFTNNWFGDIVAMAGDGMIIEDNDFTRTMHCYSRLTNYTVRNNRWIGGSANYDTEKDHGATITGNIYSNTAISGEYYKMTGFTNKLVYQNETVNGGKFVNHKSLVLKNSTIDLNGVTSTPFQGSFYNCTIKNVDGTTNGSKHNGIVLTGTYCDTCTITNSSFFPSKESVFNNGSLSGSKRIRLDSGTLEVVNNAISGVVIVLNGGTKATIKNNRLSNISGNFITNNAGVSLDASSNG